MHLAADLHIHSCLSPCADAEMTPNNIVNMAYVKKLDVIAVTDHNSAKNLPALAGAAKKRGLVFLPGLEVQSREEVHLLCYFGSLDAALAFGEEIYGFLPDIPNRPDLFGEQTVMDECDAVIGAEPRLLVQSLPMSVEQVCARTEDFGGLVVPAHVNRNANSILYNLGFIPPGLDFPVLEACVSAPAPAVDLSKYRVIYTSDAHTLGAILEPEQIIKAPERSAQGVLQALKKGLCGPVSGES